jgi:hypothetical protein
MTTQVPGHGLLSEGAAYRCGQFSCDHCAGRGGIVRVFNVGIGGQGHPRCACGWVGPWLASGAARRRAHNEHKKTVT